MSFKYAMQYMFIVQRELALPCSCILEAIALDIWHIPLKTAVGLYNIGAYAIMHGIAVYKSITCQCIGIALLTRTLAYKGI